MASADLTISLYLPRCSLCFCEALTSEQYLVQLTCCHMFCIYCVADTYLAQSGYRCPFDNHISLSYAFNSDLHERALWLTSSPGSLPADQAQQQIDYLKSSFNFYGVFCRRIGCPQANCPYVHDNWFREVGCPLGSSCWRGGMCIFQHSVQSVGGPQSLPASTWFMSTVQVQEALSKGSVVIRSQSVLQYLTGNNCAELNNIFLRVLGSVPQYNMKTQPIEFRTSISWLYMTQTGEVQEFSSYHSTLLEQTRRTRGWTIALDSVSAVYLVPMLRLYQNGGYEAVARLDKVNSTSDAAVLEVTCDSQYFNVLNQELRRVEVEEQLGKQLQGERLKEICSQFGLATRNNVVIGTQYSLAQARMTFAADQSTVFRSIECVPIPGNFPAQFLSQICDLYRVVAFNSYFYGESSNIISLLSMLNNEYASVPCPADANYQEVSQACVELGCVYENGYISGTKGAVNMLLMRIGSCQAYAPQDVDPLRLVSLPNHANVRVEGGMIIGSKANVATALQIVGRKQEKARYPAGIPKQTVERVAQQYSLKVDGTSLVGDQRNILQALDELNKAPAQSGFQHHRVPDWYQTQTTEMNIQGLSESDREYQMVATQFNQSMSDCSKILAIERVQNRRLYTNFAYKHEAFSKVEGRCIEIKRLFHGTSGTDPSVIFQSDVGLDNRMVKQGAYWGSGTYYAERARYSHDYCHRTSATQCQMFLCSVITGDSITLPRDDTLVRPPNKKGSTSCYHSVNGNTENTNVWITYEPAMSYPSYLITYEADQELQVLDPILFMMLVRLMASADDDDDDQ